MELDENYTNITYQDTDNKIIGRPKLFIAVVDNNQGKIAIDVFPNYEVAEKWCKVLTRKGSVFVNYYIDQKEIWF